MIRELAISQPAKEGKSLYQYTKWETVFDMPVYKEHFRSPEKSTVRYSATGTLDLMAQRARTWSPIAVLSDEKRAEFVDEMRQIILTAEDLVWVDEKEGMFQIPYAVPVVVIRRS